MWSMERAEQRAFTCPCHDPIPTRKATPMLDYLSLTVIPDGVISTINTVTFSLVAQLARRSLLTWPKSTQQVRDVRDVIFDTTVTES